MRVNTIAINEEIKNSNNIEKTTLSKTEYENQLINTYNGKKWIHPETKQARIYFGYNSVKTIKYFYQLGDNFSKYKFWFDLERNLFNHNVSVKDENTLLLVNLFIKNVYENLGVIV